MHFHFENVSRALFLLSIYVSRVLTTTFRTSTWNLESVNKDIDVTIISLTKEFDTLASCTSLCSTIQVELGEIISLYYIESTNTCHCNLAFDYRPEDTNVGTIQYGTLQSMHETPQNDFTTNIDKWPSRTDCLALYESGYTLDGIYSILQWDGSDKDVYCDMNNGGWTIIQRRFDGSVNFYRGWEDYRLGFGNVNGEYWVGLENIHHLTLLASELSIHIEAFPGVTPPSGSANYTDFSVGDSVSNFRLTVSGFSGTCGDSFSNTHNGQPFTTYDRDNDNKHTNCAVEYKGGWWYNICHTCNLNGYYYNPGEYSVSTASGINWYTCWYFQTSQQKTTLKIRRKP